MNAEEKHLKLAVEQLIKQDPLIDGEGIEVESELGFINLKGFVQDLAQKKLVEDTVRAFAGVKDVFNYLTLKPKGLV